MERHRNDSLSDGELELAALYALSALAPDELEALERDFRERAAFWAEVRSLRDAAAGLAASGPRRKPRRDLWPEIRARVTNAERTNAERAQPSGAAADQTQLWKHWRGAPAVASLVLTSENGGFEPTDIEGIAVRRLFVDEEGDRVGSGQRVQRRHVRRVDDGEEGNQEIVLPAQTQRRAARRQHLQRRADLKQIADPRRGAEQVLDVVEDQ